MDAANPFRPGFGKQPPVMAGRQDQMSRIWSALESGPKSPDYAIILTGMRGCGKTALMSAMREQARERGWGVIKATASGDGGLERLLRERALQRTAVARRFPRAHRRNEAPEGMIRRGARRMRGLNAMAIGAAWDGASPSALTDTLLRVGRRAAARNRGVLLTLDEMHQATDQEIKHLAVVLQEVAGEEEVPVAFIGAGLPELREKIDSAEGMTFFQRCGRVPIGLLSETDARQALASPVQESAKRIDEGAMAAAVAASRGYPYKLQLIGYHAWEGAGDAEQITAGIVHGATYMADQAMLAQVVLPLWTHLSGGEQDLLAAMAADHERSTAQDISARLDKSPDEVRHMLRRMEVVGVVERLDADECQFTHPLMQRWINGETDQMPGRPDVDVQRFLPEDRQPRLSTKQQILDAHRAAPDASNAQIARRTGASRSYVGKVLNDAGQRKPG